MKFTCNTAILQKGINIVEKAISQRTSLPILENLYVETAGDKLKLRGNDLEIGIEASIDIESIEKDGTCLLNAKTISNIVSKLPNQNITIEVSENNQVSVKGNKNVDFDILSLSTEEYPVFPEITQGSEITVDIQELKNQIKHTIFAVSFDDTKQFLKGILIESEASKLTFVATDGYRLAMRQTKIDSQNSKVSVIVPFKAMNELNKIIQSSNADETVKIIFSENQVAFLKDDFVLISRVIQGKFPDYSQVIPSEINNQFKLPRRSLLEAAERASIIAVASNNVVRLHFDSNSLEINAVASSLGKFKEAIDISQEKGSDVSKIAFNVRLILDSVKNLETDDLIIEFNNELSPCVIRPISQDDYIYVIMPIRTSDFQDVAEQSDSSTEQSI